MTEGSEIGTELVDIGGVRSLVVRTEGAAIASEGAARDLIGDALADGASMIVLPVGRLDASFFQLRTGLAAAILQKMVNYRRRLAIVGDISGYVAASDSFRDLVRECDRGRDVVFARDLNALAERLSRSG